MTNDIIAHREAIFGPNVPTFYETQAHLIKGKGVWAWVAGGNKSLDCYNKVPHVGHFHPHVVAAIYKQAAILNTHTRYLHDGIIKYAERALQLANQWLTTT